MFKKVAEHPNDLLDVNSICDARDRLQQKCFNAGNRIAEQQATIYELNEQLAASQAREAALREALEAIANRHRAIVLSDVEIAMKALAIPFDTTTLDRSNKLYAAEVLKELDKVTGGISRWRIFKRAEQLRKEAGE